MGLFDWLTKSKAPPASLPMSSGLSRTEATQPFGRTQHPPTGQVRGSRSTGGGSSSGGSAGESPSEQKKNARYMRRELLYGIVRESMIRAGVLSAGYKFKALALDPRGLQFIVMVDLAAEFGASQDRWSEIESLIAQSAKARHGVVVKAVYWRLSEQVSVGKPSPSIPGASNPAAPVLQAQSSMASAASAGLAAAAAAAAVPAKSVQHVAPIEATMPMPRSGPISKPMPLFPEGPDTDDAIVDFDVTSEQAGTMRQMAPGSARFEPIADDEVEAFKRALAAGANAQTALAKVGGGVPVKKPAPGASNGNYTLLTGFEDTEAVDPDFAPPALGSTQYGELR